MTPIEEVRDLFARATTETQYRTVASRAYYATYAAIMSFVPSLGFSAGGTGADHGRLARFLAQQANPLLQRIGKFRLPRLRALRNRADYELHLRFTNGHAEEAVRTAEEVIDWIEALRPSSGST